MNEGIQTLLIILAVLAFVTLVLTVVLPYLKRKDIDVQSIIDSSKAALANAGKAMDLLRPFLDEVEGVAIFDKIKDAAEIGVGNAEQLYKIGELGADERNAAAKEYVAGALKLMGVEVTSEVQRLVDGAIQNDVLNLGHKPE